MPLVKALESFPCDIDEVIMKKIGFKDEILFILNNYEKNPNILKPGVISKITTRKYTIESTIDVDVMIKNSDKEYIVKEVTLYDDLIAYAVNDTKVLYHLYCAVNKVFIDVL